MSAPKDAGYGPFTAEEMTILLEAARIGLAEAETFDGIAEQMDIADAELAGVREKLQGFLG